METKLYSEFPPQEQINEIKKYDKENISDFFSDPFTFNIGIATNGNEVLGAGVIRVINEFKIIINPTLSDFRKAKVINTLIKEAFKNAQCNEIIVDITQGGDHYINILNKHFGFQKAYGEVLRLER